MRWGPLKWPMTRARWRPELAPLDRSDGASAALEKWVEPQLSWEVSVMTRRNADLEIRDVTVVSYLSPGAAGI
jgi:hypothetical protein